MTSFTYVLSLARVGGRGCLFTSYLQRENCCSWLAMGGCGGVRDGKPIIRIGSLLLIADVHWPRVDLGESLQKYSKLVHRAHSQGLQGQVPL